MTENSKKHIDACRFCWMCRHICPIGNATGLERNTSRARALGLSLVNREAYGIEEVVDNVYECACCGACTKECVTGWDPVMFTKEARLDAAMEGKLPEYINVLVDNCLATGNAYGATEIDADLKAAIAAHAGKTDTLLFLGVDAVYKVPAAAINAIKVLEKAGVAFTVLEGEPASGQQLEYLISAANETKEQMTACAKVIGAYKAQESRFSGTIGSQQTSQLAGIECNIKIGMNAFDLFATDAIADVEMLSRYDRCRFHPLK